MNIVSPFIDYFQCLDISRTRVCVSFGDKRHALCLITECLLYLKFTECRALSSECISNINHLLLSITCRICVTIGVASMAWRVYCLAGAHVDLHALQSECPNELQLVKQV